MPARKTKPKLRPKLTPTQVETITRVWLATANASEAAREAGCSTRSAIRYILRAALPNSATLYAQALERAEQEALAAVVKGRRKAAERLGKARNTRDVTDALRALNDSLRAVSSTRVAHAKATGSHAPEQINATVAARVVVLPSLDDVGTEAAGNPVAPERGPADSVPGE